MPLSCTSQDRTLTAAIQGDIDHHSAKTLMAELRAELDRSLPLHLILDCSQISFMDSSGIAILLRLQQHMSNIGGTMLVLHLPKQASKVLRAAGIDRLITIQ